MLQSLNDLRVAIVGLGLMGGSLALALRGQCREIIGVDVDAANLDVAVQNGFINRAATFDDALCADLIILATPPRIILSQLADLAQSAINNQKSTILLDLGSTKAAIVAAMRDLPAGFDPIGGHPMCGKEVSGLAHAEADLFRDKTFILTPLERTSSRAQTLCLDLIRAIGARPLILEPERHDRLVALASHLPYLVALALVQTAQTCEDDALWHIASSGFRDTSRLAASDLTMMTDILLTNRATVLQTLRQYRAELDDLLTTVELADAADLRAALAPAQAKRAELFR